MEEGNEGKDEGYAVKGVGKLFGVDYTTVSAAAKRFKEKMGKKEISIMLSRINKKIGK